MDDGTIAVICFFFPQVLSPWTTRISWQRPSKLFSTAQRAEIWAPSAVKWLLNRLLGQFGENFQDFWQLKVRHPEKNLQLLMSLIFVWIKGKLELWGVVVFLDHKSYVKNFAARWGSGYRRDVRTAGLGFDGDLLFTRLRMKAENGSRIKKTSKNRPKV